ncbi:MAG TPA: inositol monophosphatase family protein [Acidobacteriota bacterium]|nr:inositol monophosphatase family protein [Acidobacteriota bacterium]HNU01134.1 inositol monophosphatase family protein [Acidobacteriota bacterium]HPB26769.1 inositol monophosphatase family protein [Acidobacteriota bacterium]HQO26085.1 inositol monophosphatase family protein [Acidobacteriota bacterium]HQP75058.1 inositol monophosphatase family protein [Acidobacteriota bacterium]
MEQAWLAAAREAARAAGNVLMRHFGRTLDVRKKGAIDLVTQADLQAEAAVLDRLRTAFPGHGFLLEESGARAGSGEYTWVIDPLDGTTNFVHGYPPFGVSVGLVRGEEPLLGVVYAPALGEEFWAVRGGGAWLNGAPIRVSACASLREAMLATGFPYDAHTADDIVPLFAAFLRQAQAIRRDGSAALDLCYAAMGRFDGFWERRLRPWDTAAGAAILAEAGGRLSRFDGGPFSIHFPEIVASNGRIHAQMLAVTGGDQSPASFMKA